MGHHTSNSAVDTFEITIHLGNFISFFFYGNSILILTFIYFTQQIMKNYLCLENGPLFFKKKKKKVQSGVNASFNDLKNNFK